MTRPKTLKIIVILSTVIVSISCYLALSKKESDYHLFFEQNCDLLQSISNDLLVLNIPGEIRSEAKKKISIELDSGELDLEVQSQVVEDIKKLFLTNEISCISIREGYIQYVLNNPPKNYRGWYVYDPDNTFWGGADIFTEHLAEGWILEIVPNT